MLQHVLHGVAGLRATVQVWVLRREHLLICYLGDWVHSLVVNWDTVVHQVHIKTTLRCNILSLANWLFLWWNSKGKLPIWIKCHLLKLLCRHLIVRLMSFMDLPRWIIKLLLGQLRWNITSFTQTVLVNISRRHVLLYRGLGTCCLELLLARCRCWISDLQKWWFCEQLRFCVHVFLTAVVEMQTLGLLRRIIILKFLLTLDVLCRHIRLVQWSEWFGSHVSNLLSLELLDIHGWVLESYWLLLDAGDCGIRLLAQDSAATHTVLEDYSWRYLRFLDFVDYLLLLFH